MDGDSLSSGEGGLKKKCKWHGKKSSSSSIAGKVFSRRKFVKKTLASTVILGSTPQVFAGTEGQKRKVQSSTELLFRFLQIIHGESLEEIKDDFKYLREKFLDGLSIPFYPIMGNHECVQQEGDPEYEPPFIETYGSNQLNYSFDYKGIEFIIFTNSGTYVIPDEQEYARKEILKKLLQKKNLSCPKLSVVTFQSPAWVLILMILLYIRFLATGLTWKLSEFGLIFSSRLQTSTEPAVIRRILPTGHILVTRSTLWVMKMNGFFHRVITT